MASTNNKFDAQLHILRSVARSIEGGRESQFAESARYNLFAALEAADRPAALDWLEALEVCLRRAVPTLDAATMASVDRAISTIRSGLTLVADQKAEVA